MLWQAQDCITSSELYIPFDFQAAILLFTCFVVLNVAW